MSRIMPDSWPLPALNSKTRPFFTSGRILIQTCSECGHAQHPPEDVCRQCQGMRFAFREHSAHGTVHSHAEVTYPVHPALADAVPYVVVLVSLDDAPEIRVVGNLKNPTGPEIRIGMRVRAEWAEATDRASDEIYKIPQWVAVQSASD